MLSLKQSLDIANSVLAQGKSAGFAPLSVAVLDPGGFPYNPIGRNARDLDLFVRLFGFTPIEALVAATRHGGALMGLPVGEIKPGMLADLLLVDGDPTTDVTVLQDKNNLRAIMKDGRFFKSPAIH
jgi:imidazolonepropionase-like amidohydrolase